MAENDAEKAKKGDELPERFPGLPPVPEIPPAPRLAPVLPPHPDRNQPGKVEPGAYNKAALATTAASAFIMPIIVLSLGGWWLDKKFGTNWIAFVGVLVGLVVGVSALLRIVQKLSD